MSMRRGRGMRMEMYRWLKYNLKHSLRLLVLLLWCGRSFVRLTKLSCVLIRCV